MQSAWIGWERDPGDAAFAGDGGQWFEPVTDDGGVVGSAGQGDCAVGGGRLAVALSHLSARGVSRTAKG
jgi:hypothetical protein